MFIGTVVGLACALHRSIRVMRSEQHMNCLLHTCTGTLIKSAGTATACPTAPAVRPITELAARDGVGGPPVLLHLACDAVCHARSCSYTVMRVPAV